MRELLILVAFVSYHLIDAASIQQQETTTTTTAKMSNSSTTRRLPQMQIRKEMIKVECPYKPQCTCDQPNGELVLFCANFTYFSELNFTTSSNNGLIFDKIRIIPLKEQELNENNLDLNGLSIHSLGTIELANINKFYYRSNPLLRLNNTENRFTVILKLVNCTFEFAYDNRTPLNSVCSGTNLINATAQETSTTVRMHSLMSSANAVHIEGAKFIEPICPFLFHNVKMTNLYVTSPRDGSFRFLDVPLDSRLIEPEPSVKRDRENTTVLNCRLKYLHFTNVTFNSLDSNVLSKFVFYNVKTIGFRNVAIKSINEKVFSNFPYLNQIDLNLANWQTFVANVNLDILFRNLNANPTRVDFNNTKAKVDFKNKMTLQLDASSSSSSSSSQYDFPDSDFCRFARFPFDILVRTFVYTRSNNCTCTIKWLDKHAEKYPSDSDYSRSAGSNCRRKTDCDFEALERPCPIEWSKQERLLATSESHFYNVHPLIVALIVTVAVVLVIFLIGFIYKCAAVKRPRSGASRGGVVMRRRSSKHSDSFQVSYSVDNEETVLDRANMVATNSPDSTVIVSSSNKKNTPSSGTKVVKKSKFYRTNT